MNMHEQHDMMTDNQDEFLRKSENIIINMASGGAQQYNIRSSRYLVPAQDLLTEFCNLGTKHNDHSKKTKAQRTGHEWQDQDNLNNINASSSKNKPLNSLEFLELQKRKSKLLQMLEEV